MAMDRRRFLESSLAAATLASTGGLSSLHATTDTRTRRLILQARGLGIFEGNKPVRLRGVNLGGWMLIEDYMIGLPWTEWKIREQFKKLLGPEAYAEFFTAFDEAYIADADISFLAQQGFNVARVPFNYRHFENDLAPGQWIESGFAQLDRVVRLCQKHNIWVILDLHAALGAQARDQNAGSAYGETYLWKYKNFMDRTIALWAELARRYNGDPTIAGYNLICEPVTADVALLNKFYAETIRAIRKDDRDHLIILDPNLWAKDVSSLHDELFSDPQVMPVLHHYYGENHGWSQLTTYPTIVDGKSFDRNSLANTLEGKYDQLRIVRPVMVSEFGVSRSEPQAFAVQLAITRDLVSIFEEKGWGWSMWCYKDLREMGLVTPRADTPWRRFLESPRITSFLQQYRALEAPFKQSVEKLLAGTDITHDVRDQWAREVSRDFDVPALDFVLRRMSAYPTSELAAMARSFSFASCEVHQDQLATLKPFLV